MRSFLPQIFWLSLSVLAIGCGSSSSSRRAPGDDAGDAGRDGSFVAEASSDATRPGEDGKPPIRVEVHLTGSGSGTVSSSPAGITCGDVCQGNFPGSEPVTLTAAAAEGSRFAGWQGGCAGTSPTCTLSPGEESAVSVTAVFEIETFQVTLTLGGAGSGVVGSAGGEIGCGGEGADAGTCTAEVPFGTELTLTATPSSGSVFDGWSGGCSGNSPCHIVVSADTDIGAEFGLGDSSLEVTRSGNGEGHVAADAGELACPAACSEAYPLGTLVTLTATPSDSSVFVGWSGACSGAAADCTVTVDAVKTVNAEFALKEYALTLAMSGAGTGSITVDPPPGSCDGGGCPLEHGTEVTIVARPGVGATFLGWNGDGCSGTSPTCTLVMEGPHTVEAVFALDDYGVTVAKAGSGAGRVTSKPAGVDCGSKCAVGFPFGTSVVLTAAPAASSRFVSFTGCDTAAGSECTVSVDRARQVTARFDLLQHSVTVAKGGTGTGTVTADSGAIDCGATCQGNYAHGTTLVLAAAASANATFTGWTGCPDAVGATCTVTVTADTSVTANFALRSYTLTAALAGNGSGTVTSSPAGIGCGSDCTQGYAHGTSVVLTAAAAASSTFTSWSGCDSVAGNQCTVSVTNARTVTATFTLRRYTLTAALAGNGTGTLTSSPAGIACTGDCTQDYNHGTSVVLTAAAAASSTFASWSGCDSVAGNQCTVSVTNAHTVTATFTLRTYTLTAALAGSGSGTLTSSPAGISCGADCTQPYNHGTSVVLTAAAAANSTLGSFTGCDSVVGNQCTVSVTNARTVTATFTLRRYTLTAALAGTGTGTLTSSPAGITCTGDCTQDYNHGTSVVLTAAAAASSTFTSWSGCDSVAGNQCTVSVTNARTVTATFTLKSYTLTAVIGTSGPGTVTSAPAGINCPTDCTQAYTHGTVVRLTATGGTGYKLGSWTNCPSVAGNRCTVTVTAARTVTANFVRDTPPSVVITSPATGTHFDTIRITPGLSYYDITLTGTATDPEDGALGGASLVWTTDGTVPPQVTLLGTGATVTARIYSDQCYNFAHTITLTATDSAGNAASASIVVYLDDNAC